MVGLAAARGSRGDAVGLVRGAALRRPAGRAGISPRRPAGPDRSGFLSAFCTLVGTHGTHVRFGLIWIVVMMAQVAEKGLTAPVRSRLLRLGLFWHFLDIIWVGIFSIVYLLGVM